MMFKKNFLASLLISSFLMSGLTILPTLSFAANPVRKVISKRLHRVRRRTAYYDDPYSLEASLRNASRRNANRQNYNNYGTRRSLR